MSHNLHFVHCWSSNPEEAMRMVEQEIESWGNENNWRTILYAVDTDNNITDADSLEDRYKQWDKITFKNIDDLIRKDSQHMWCSEQGIAAMNKWHKEPLTANDWSMIKYFADQKEHEDEGKFFKIENWDTYHDWELDEIGVTNFDNKSLEDDKEYLVVLDMHS